MLSSIDGIVWSWEAIEGAFECGVLMLTLNVGSGVTVYDRGAGVLGVEGGNGELSGVLCKKKQVNIKYQGGRVVITLIGGAVGVSDLVETVDSGVTEDSEDSDEGDVDEPTLVADCTSA